MTAGWILCLALVSQSHSFATPSDGWRAGTGTQPAVTPTQYMSPASGQQQFDQYGRVQPQQQQQPQRTYQPQQQTAYVQPRPVVQYTQPIGPTQPQYATQAQAQPQTQPATQPAQHPWQTGGNQQVAQQQPAQQQDRFTWQQTPAQNQQGPALNPAQNNTQHNTQPHSGWGNQTQQQQPQQPPTWGNHQFQQSGQSQFANNKTGQQPQQAGSQFGGSQFGTGQQQYGAQIGQGGNQFQTGGQQTTWPQNNSQQDNSQQNNQPPSNWGQGTWANNNGGSNLQPVNPTFQPNQNFNQGSQQLQPPLQATLPSGGQPPRADVDNTQWANWQNQTNQQNPAVTTVANTDQNQQAGNGQTPTIFGQPKTVDRLPSFFTGADPGSKANTISGFGLSNNNSNVPKSGMFASANGGVGGAPKSVGTDGPAAPYEPTNAIIISLIALFFSLGANLYLGWIAFESHFRYRRVLADADEYEEPRRNRDDERGLSRRR